MSQEYFRGFDGGSPSYTPRHTREYGRSKERHTGRWIRDGNRIIVFSGDESPYGEFDDGRNEYRTPEFEMDLAPLPACNNKDFPARKVRVPKDVTRVQCESQSQYKTVKQVVQNAVNMLDHTIDELTRAREAACRGETLAERHIQAVTICWLKYHLGVCVDDPSVWTKGTFENKTVAETIRRLVRPRDLLANNEITYICDRCDLPNNNNSHCSPGNACSWPKDENGRCLPGSPPRIIYLCPSFWADGHTPYREQTIIHEAAHITHCDGGEDSPDEGVGVSIGFAECLAQFVVATNWGKLDPFHTPHSGPPRPGDQICGYTSKCGAIPKDVLKGNCPQ
jgi:hypothetical protein